MTNSIQDLNYDLICLSHLRWDSVFQRPHHLMTRFARTRRVLFVQEPVQESGAAFMQVSQREEGIRVATPHLPPDLAENERFDVQRQLVNAMLDEFKVHDYATWYYTPMALEFTRHLQPLATVYDCMDELSAFAGAPRPLREREAELFRRADLVFTGGQSLYEAKREQHPRVYAFPSSVEAAHFAGARAPQADPVDQANIPHPRLGFFGVIDERMDLELVRGMADAHPEWHLVMIGPVVKVNPAHLPRRKNIHYLGPKAYVNLPSYLAGWDVALLPFARNEATRFISPTKTPEYLAGGKPVVSTSIRDVVRPYGESGLVRIADTVSDFVLAVEASMAEKEKAAEWLARVDAFLAQTSWDNTFAQMSELIDNVIITRRIAMARTPQSPVGAEPVPLGATAGATAE